MTRPFRLTHPEPDEAAVLCAVMQYLAYDRRVHRAWRVNSGAMPVERNGRRQLIRFNGASGHSDIAGVLVGGRALFVEAKTRRGRLTEHQQRFLDDMLDAGAVAGVARGIEDVQALLDGASEA